MALGMALIFHLGEGINGLKSIIKNANEDKELFEIIKGPDFPTGGQVMVEMASEKLLELEEVQ